MAIYEYSCSKCNKHIEEVRRIGDFTSPLCCGQSMVKLMSLPQPAIFPVSNRNQLINTLNNDDKATKLPDSMGKHKERYEAVIKKSLTREKEVIGVGF